MGLRGGEQLRNLILCAAVSLRDCQLMGLDSIAEGDYTPTKLRGWIAPVIGDEFTKEC